MCDLTEDVRDSEGVASLTSRVAVIAGDGIGKEVIPAGIQVLKKAAAICGARLDLVDFPWGCDFYVANGRMMDADAYDRLADFDAIYLGGIRGPRVPAHISGWEFILPLPPRSV